MRVRPWKEFCSVTMVDAAGAVGVRKLYFLASLDGALIGLRARIAEERPAHARRPAELVGEGRLHRAV